MTLIFYCCKNFRPLKLQYTSWNGSLSRAVGVKKDVSTFQKIGKLAKVDMHIDMKIAPVYPKPEFNMSAAAFVPVQAR